MNAPRGAASGRRAACVLALLWAAATPASGQTASLHPEVTLRDARGEIVDDHGVAVSARTTCGECHDVDFITTHTTHGPGAFAAPLVEGLPRGLAVPGAATDPTPDEVDCLACHLPPDRADFDAGLLRPTRTENCLACHDLEGIVDDRRLSDSDLNLAGKTTLTRSADVHAERLVECADCHRSSNDPVFAPATDPAEVPAGLLFDPRRIEPGAWLHRPDHRLAGSADAALDCTDCHDPTPSHRWLPYAERHGQALTCEACHTPVVYTPRVETVDWTVLGDDGRPALTWRGCDGPCDDDPARLLTGWTPALLAEAAADGRTRLAPYELITAWRWVDERGADVPLAAVRAASAGAPDRASVGRALAAAGIPGPRVDGRVDARPVHHGTAPSEWATRECTACHQSDSRLADAVVLTGPAPDLPAPALAVADDGLALAGTLERDAAGRVVYRTDPASVGVHVLGHHRAGWADRIGVAALLATLLGVAGHAGLRWRARRRGVTPAAHTAPRVYMYTVYERLWHWLQAGALMALLWTGLEIHAGWPGVASFAVAVRMHNVMAWIVVANALLAAFYHLASGDIRQFLPEPRGFFAKAAVQARYYLWGIFRGDPHPFARTPEQKLNPLQQITYLGILNVLLPLQVLTGIAMWGAQRWPAVDGVLGGLAFLAPVHALAAWLFAAFLLMHVYLTTTGPTPTAHIQAMVAGWDGGEVPDGEPVA